MCGHGARSIGRATARGTSLAGCEIEGWENVDVRVRGSPRKHACGETKEAWCMRQGMAGSAPASVAPSESQRSR